MNSRCPFCEIASHDESGRIVDQNEFGFVIRDGYAVSEGHSLIVIKRHVVSFFEINSEERQGLLDLLAQTQSALDTEYGPDAYNVGINDGEAAGQTVPHLHIHLIPRYRGDVNDPRGGIRWIFPEKAVYWSD